MFKKADDDVKNLRTLVKSVLEQGLPEVAGGVAEQLVDPEERVRG